LHDHHHLNCRCARSGLLALRRSRCNRFPL